MHQPHERLNKVIFKTLTIIPRGKILIIKESLYMKKFRIMEIEHLKTQRVEFRAS